MERGRFEAFFVYNRATTRGDLWERLQKNSSNDNVLAVLNSIPKEGRPGNFWAPLLNDPKVTAFPGVKMIKLKGYPFFPDRLVVLSVGLKTPSELEDNLSEAMIRDMCLAKARSSLAAYSSGAQFFEVTKDGVDAKVSQMQGDLPMPFVDMQDLSLIHI